MATKRPSFLKRQKEQKRAARALEKREARRARRQEKTPSAPYPATESDPIAPESNPTPMSQDGLGSHP